VFFYFFSFTRWQTNFTGSVGSGVFWSKKSNEIKISSRLKFCKSFSFSFSFSFFLFVNLICKLYWNYLDLHMWILVVNRLVNVGSNPFSSNPFILFCSTKLWFYNLYTKVDKWLSPVLQLQCLSVVSRFMWSLWNR
jgi:hypothetical protein